MANTIIGNSIVVDGRITGKEDLVIQGTVKGHVELEADVYVEESGVVEADIAATSVEISGQVTGNVGASDKVEITTGGQVIGNLRAPRLIIADGATLKGNVEMEE